MSIDYTAWYQNAKSELHKVLEEKTNLELALIQCDKQIAALLQTVNAMAPLAGEEPVIFPFPGNEMEGAPGGMTDSIRAILTEAGEPLSAADIRDRLTAKGFDMTAYSNPLANIHTILRRLTESKTVEPSKTADAPAAGAKKFTIAAGLVNGKPFNVEKLAGKSFEIGKLKGLVGVGRLHRRKRVD